MIAKAVGNNASYAGLQLAEIQRLAPTDGSIWLTYMERSNVAAMEAARTYSDGANSGTQAVKTRSESSGNAIRMNRDSKWYHGAEALQIATNVISYQTPSGGWGKNNDYRKRSGLLASAGFSASSDPGSSGTPAWISIAGTIDNSATVAELRYLGAVLVAGGGSTEQRSMIAHSYARGFKYLINAQYPNGGWPQVWPLAGGYHDAITLNDNAMVRVLELFRDVIAHPGDYPDLDADVTAAIEPAYDRGVQLLLELQSPSGGWAQQYDPVLLAPVGARKYEMASLSSLESAYAIRFLLTIDDEDERMTKAIAAGRQWLRSVAIRDTALEGRHLVKADGSRVWARYYDLVSMSPLFGDRDGHVYENLADISDERRNGYRWYTTSPELALK